MIPHHLAFLFFVAAVGAALLSMGAYAVLDRRRDPDVVGKGGQFLAGMGDFPLHWFMWVMSPLVAFSRRAGLTADFYNYVGLLFGLASGWFIGIGRLEIGGWMIVSSGIADVLDGRIARLMGVASDYGDFIDSTFDRFVEASTFLGFAYYLRRTEWGALIAGAALAGSLIVSYARARGEVSGVVCTKGLMQRGERLLITALVCFLAPTLSAFFGLDASSITQWALGLIAGGTLITAVYRTAWIAARLRGQR
jgi:CDP-diacylglycerol---glycerol-3-phosphate 3-phosphatidyltransferase